MLWLITNISVNKAKIDCLQKVSSKVITLNQIKMQLFQSPLLGLQGKLILSFRAFHGDAAFVSFMIIKVFLLTALCAALLGKKGSEAYKTCVQHELRAFIVSRRSLKAFEFWFPFLLSSIKHCSLFSLWCDSSRLWKVKWKMYVWQVTEHHAYFMVMLMPVPHQSLHWDKRTSHGNFLEMSRKSLFDIVDLILIAIMNYSSESCCL